MISAKIITHSVNPDGKDLVTFLLKYPRFIHSELMTHRCASKNAASSRAIPYERMRDEILANPAMPEKWGAAQKGMQSGDEINHIDAVSEAWIDSLKSNILYTNQLNRLGLHKSITNRLLEPWAHMTTVLTVDGGGFESIMRLRAHPDAQPEFQVLAYNMLDKYFKSAPTSVNWNQWHIPFTSIKEDGHALTEKLIKSSARCAWTSYGNPEKDSTFEACENTYDKLVNGDQFHASPFEHQAFATQHRCPGNFNGWHQYRHLIENDKRAALSKPLPSLKEIMSTKPEWVNIYE